MSAEDRIKRLKFRSWHRGTREMDLLLGSFAEAQLGHFTPQELDQYEALLQQSDPDLYGWIMGTAPVPAECDNGTVQKLCAHRFADRKAV